MAKKSKEPAPWVYRLILIGCAHIGAKAAEVQNLKDHVDLAAEKNTFLLILGDVFENAIPARGLGMMFEQNLNPEEQLDEADRIFRPYKHKIIGACTSNHSRRSYKEVGIDIDRQLYKRLGVREGIYKGLQGVVVFGGKKIAFAHGNGSGDNWNDSKKLFTIYPTADFVITSHRHEMASKWHGNYVLDSKGRKTKKFVRFVRTGGLMGWAEYAQEELYNPQKPGFSALYFMADGTVRDDTNGIL